MLAAAAAADPKSGGRPFGRLIVRHAHHSTVAGACAAGRSRWVGCVGVRRVQAKSMAVVNGGFAQQQGWVHLAAADSDSGSLPSCCPNFQLAAADTLHLSAVAACGCC